VERNSVGCRQHGSRGCDAVAYPSSGACYAARGIREPGAADRSHFTGYTIGIGSTRRDNSGCGISPQL